MTKNVQDPSKRIQIDELLRHPFLQAQRRERAMSDISDIHNRLSQYSKGQSNSLIGHNNNHEHYASSRRSSCSSRGSSREGRSSRSRSVERVPSREYMPPPSAPPSDRANTTRDQSTGYCSALSQNTSTSGSRSLRVSPRSFPASVGGRERASNGSGDNATPTRHGRQRSLPNGATGLANTAEMVAKNVELKSDVALPRINVTRLVPNRQVWKKTICHILSSERVLIESLDSNGFVSEF